MYTRLIEGCSKDQFTPFFEEHTSKVLNFEPMDVQGMGHSKKSI